MKPRILLSGRPASARAYAKRTDGKGPEMAQIHVSFAKLSAAQLVKDNALRMEDLIQKFNAEWPTIAPTFGLEPCGKANIFCVNGYFTMKDLKVMTRGNVLLQIPMSAGAAAMPAQRPQPSGAADGSAVRSGAACDGGDAGNFNGRLRRHSQHAGAGGGSAGGPAAAACSRAPQAMAATAAPPATAATEGIPINACADTANPQAPAAAAPAVACARAPQAVAVTAAAPAGIPIDACADTANTPSPAAACARAPQVTAATAAPPATAGRREFQSTPAQQLQIRRRSREFQATPAQWRRRRQGRRRESQATPAQPRRCGRRRWRSGAATPPRHAVHHGQFDKERSGRRGPVLGC